MRRWTFAAGAFFALAAAENQRTPDAGPRSFEIESSLRIASTMSLYTCSGCGASVSKHDTSCPKCRVRLVGIRCTHCFFAGSESDFPNDRCPKCGHRVYRGGSGGGGGEQRTPRHRCGIRMPSCIGRVNCMGNQLCHQGSWKSQGISCFTETGRVRYATCDAARETACH